MVNKINKSAVWIGVKSGLISSLCCITPMFLVLLLVLFGIGSTSLLIGSLVIAQYKYWFIAAGFLFMSLSLYLYLKRENKGVCNINTLRKNKSILGVALIIYILIIIVTLYVLLPFFLRYI